jgi:hypothetical protein
VEIFFVGGTDTVSELFPQSPKNMRFFTSREKTTGNAQRRAHRAMPKWPAGASRALPISDVPASPRSRYPPNLEAISVDATSFRKP